MKTQDYYSILGVAPNASGDEVKWAYRRLAQRFHPDVSDDPDGEQKFKAVAEAYRTLKRAETRRLYDLRGFHGEGGGEFVVFDNFFQVWCALLLWPIWSWVWLN